MENNQVSIKRSTLWKVGMIIGVIMFLAVLIFFLLRDNFGGSLTGNSIAAGDNEIQKAELYMKNYEYKVEPSVLKKGIPVRMAVDVDSLVGCARGVVIKDFGIRKSVTKTDNIIEFTPDQTGTINIACSMNMYHGTFTVIE